MHVAVSIGIIVYMLVLSVLDIRSKKVPTVMLWVFVALLALELGINSHGRIYLSLLGGAVGLVMLVVSRLTKEALGYGDGMLILGLGIYMGLWDVLWLLMFAFFGAGMLSIGLLIFRKANKKTTLPFMPFICGSYILLYITA